MNMAHTRGSTALHVAALTGQTHLVEWLLAHGAGRSLDSKNKLGKTPLDLAKIFGPHSEVEDLLSAALLDEFSLANLTKGSLQVGSPTATAPGGIGHSVSIQLLIEQGEETDARTESAESNLGKEAGEPPAENKKANTPQKTDVADLQIESMEDNEGNQSSSCPDMSGSGGGNEAGGGRALSSDAEPWPGRSTGAAFRSAAAGARAAGARAAEPELAEKLDALLSRMAQVARMAEQESAPASEDAP